MIYGYARVSTIGQASDSDVCRGKAKYRPELDKPDASLVVTKLNRMARNLMQGIQLIEYLTDKRITVDVLNIGRIDEVLTGRIMRNIMLAFSGREVSAMMEVSLSMLVLAHKATLQ